jgi:hypothetical protein
MTLTPLFLSLPRMRFSEKGSPQDRGTGPFTNGKNPAAGLGFVWRRLRYHRGERYLFGGTLNRQLSRRSYFVRSLI